MGGLVLLGFLASFRSQRTEDWCFFARSESFESSGARLRMAATTGCRPQGVHSVCCGDDFYCSAMTLLTLTRCNIVGIVSYLVNSGRIYFLDSVGYGILLVLYITP